MKWVCLAGLLVAAAEDAGTVEIPLEGLEMIVDAGMPDRPKEHRYRVILLPVPSNHDCQNSPFSDCPL